MKFIWSKICENLRTILVNILAWSCIFLVSSVKAFPKPANEYFPEQSLPKPFRLQDGQTVWDKLFIMKMLNLIERQTLIEEGITTKPPWIRDYVFEGDIILQRSQAIHLARYKNRRKKRKLDAEVTSDGAIKKWPMPINYMFDGTHTHAQREEIRRGIRDWEENTCITFTNLTETSVKSIRFINNFGCYSYVGNKQGGREQNISIGTDCARKGIVAHEIGHTLGFWHEHARADRDDYLGVVTENIKPGKQFNFKKISWGEINNLAVPYDLGSVMHYSGMQFSKGSEMTMRTHNPWLQNTIGQREELSFFDVKLANLAYCNDVCNTDQLQGNCSHDGYQDPKNCSRCRCPEGLFGDLCQSVAPSTHDCGGHINLTSNTLHTISSPGYPKFYDRGLNCYWLIQSPNGTAINIQFKKPYMQSRFCNSTHPYLPCEDFVEVRFTDSLGMTGGRFCCNDTLQSSTLSKPIITHSNHALILFKTYASGYVGFRMDVTIDSCGGCHNNVTDDQVPCKRKETTECYQTWYKLVKLNHCPLRFWACKTYYQKRLVQRKTTCYSEEPYCCKGYILSADKKNCTKDPEVASEQIENDNTADDQDNTSDPDNIEEDQATPNGWSEWTSCSKQCGGCGKQSRSRLCNGDNCIESRSCGNETCDFGNIQQTCARTYVRSQMCPFQGFFFDSSPKMCNVTVTEYFTQTMKCCCGYELKNDICQPSATQ